MSEYVPDNDSTRILRIKSGDRAPEGMRTAYAEVHSNGFANKIWHNSLPLFNSPLPRPRRRQPNKSAPRVGLLLKCASPWNREAPYHGGRMGEGGAILPLSLSLSLSRLKMECSFTGFESRALSATTHLKRIAGVRGATDRLYPGGLPLVPATFNGRADRCLGQKSKGRLGKLLLRSLIP
jgi:hypothetical protein